MKIHNIVKGAVVLASTAFLLMIPSAIVRADNIGVPEQGVAGIAYSFDNYYSSAKSVEDGSADKIITHILKTQTDSPYSNLGVSIADNYVNIRKDPTTDSKVVGKLYRGCAADITSYLDGDWVKIESGKVKGYIASNFLAIGNEAETMADKYATKYATVKTTTLNVRDKQSTDSKILTMIPKGETYIVVKEHDDWAEILLGTDEDTGKDFTGFVSKDYISIRVEFKYAISIEEENRIKKEQEEAEQAEKERKAKLAAEKAARKAEEERRAAQAQKDRDNNRNDNDNNSNNNNNNNNNNSNDDKPDNTNPSPSGTSARGSEIAAYARKFVGNPYVWGGQSLTDGADCSGFVRAIYNDFGYGIPRTSREQAAGAGRRVDIDDRQPGDLVFYTNSSGVVNHVAMYIGNDLIVQAANTRQGIIISKYNYRSVYCMRRII